ncbi:Zn(II)2Cys6 transcription factor [Colletotrichum musicola]|uniref:Zn(II)2Cys6 transcription factor n=1 Tax=Colletotrichum musicola TaxID=2175873 RepID=A0A8H6IYM4_9PEZI|nr:Zn(II)2Cys6 transcription factor [Colletotrichum musicola]
MIRTGSHIAYSFHESDALCYYRLALTAVRELLLHPHYEMIDVVGENLGSHLEDVASLHRSRQIQGDADGVRHAAYWTLYRHDIWAAMQTGRRMCLDETYWEPPPVESFECMEIEDITNRAIFILGQCVNFSNGHGSFEDVMDSGRLQQARHDAASRLGMCLDDWQAKMPPSIATFCTPTAVAHQVHHASRIILVLHQPSPVTPPLGLNKCESLSIRRRIEKSREGVFATANAGVPDAWDLLSAQCLYVAGLVTEGLQERKRTLELIDECHRRTGRQTVFMPNELKRLWKE